MASAGKQSSLSFAPKAKKPTRKTYMREEIQKSARSVISVNPRGILNNAHHIMHDLWVGPIAIYLSQLFLATHPPEREVGHETRWSENRRSANDVSVQQ